MGRRGGFEGSNSSRNVHKPPPPTSGPHAGLRGAQRDTKEEDGARPGRTTKMLQTKVLFEEANDQLNVAGPSSTCGLRGWRLILRATSLQGPLLPSPTEHVPIRALSRCRQRRMFDVEPARATRLLARARVPYC